jgi:hypothetical protein
MTAGPLAEDPAFRRAWDAALEALAADEAAGIVYGQPDAAGIARRASRGGADPLSVAVQAIAGRMWDQTGRRGFRGSVIRWRIAALIVIRCLISGWLPFVPGCPLWYLRLVAVRSGTPATWPRFRCRLTSRMTTGP